MATIYVSKGKKVSKSSSFGLSVPNMLENIIYFVRSYSKEIYINIYKYIYIYIYIYITEP